MNRCKLNQLLGKVHIQFVELRGVLGLFYLSRKTFPKKNLAVLYNFVWISRKNSFFLFLNTLFKMPKILPQNGSISSLSQCGRLFFFSGTAKVVLKGNSTHLICTENIFLPPLLHAQLNSDVACRCCWWDSFKMSSSTSSYIWHHFPDATRLRVTVTLWSDVHTTHVKFSADKHHHSKLSQSRKPFDYLTGNH